MELPNIKKADKFIINCDGLIWVYLKEEEIFVVNKDGMKTIKFEDLNKEDLIEFSKPLEGDMVFETQKHGVSLDDLKTFFDTAKEQ